MLNYSCNLCPNVLNVPAPLLLKPVGGTVRCTGGELTAFLQRMALY